MAGVTLAMLAIPVVLAAVLDGKRTRAKKAGDVSTPPPPDSTQPTKGGSLIASLPAESTGRLDDPREQMIATAVRAGLNDPLIFSEVVSVGEVGTPQEGYAIRVPVMNDSLMIEGVRVDGSYLTGQKVADLLTRNPEAPVTMLTPWMAGLAYEQADVKLAPTTSGELTEKGVTTKTSQMIEASELVDRKLAAAMKQKGLTGPVLVANGLKDWVLTIRHTEPGVHPESKVPRSQAAANHGFYTKAWRPIQNVGLAHHLTHVDYSQALRYMGGDSIVVLPDKSELVFPTAEALTDPLLGPLLTGRQGRIIGKQVGEGVLPYSRHPALGPPGGLV